MSKNTKIATCCYCGARAALVLKGRNTHELACASCGAPLHNLKSLRADAVNPKRHTPAQERRGHQSTRKGAPVTAQDLKSLVKKAKKLKKRRSSGARFLKKAFDVIEDILD